MRDRNKATPPCCCEIGMERPVESRKSVGFPGRLGEEAKVRFPVRDLRRRERRVEVVRMTPVLYQRLVDDGQGPRQNRAKPKRRVFVSHVFGQRTENREKPGREGMSASRDVRAQSGDVFRRACVQMNKRTNLAGPAVNGLV